VRSWEVEKVGGNIEVGRGNGESRGQRTENRGPRAGGRRLEDGRQSRSRNGEGGEQRGSIRGPRIERKRRRSSEDRKMGKTLKFNLYTFYPKSCCPPFYWQ